MCTRTPRAAGSPSSASRARWPERLTQHIRNRGGVGLAEGMAEGAYSTSGEGEPVAAIAGRAPPALEEVYRRHGAPVLGLARRLLLEPALAEDVVQEVFLRLWRQP